MRRIGLVVAMPEETEHILDKLGTEKSDKDIYGYKICKYELDDKIIYLINSGIGEINAATATTILITKYGVEAIINFGIAGGLKNDIRIGDLLIARDIVHYDFDVSAFFGTSKGQYLDSKTVEINCDKKLIELADFANGSKLKKVRIASADKFVANSTSKQQLVDEFDADICEMESAAIIRVSKRMGVPSLFIKTVSDNADEQAEDSMNEQANKGITAYSHLIENLMMLL